MPRVTNNLRDAQTLAEFSNLKPDRVEYFRNNYADFAPQEWWDYRSAVWGEQWKTTQIHVALAWENGFAREKDNLRNAHQLASLTMLVFDPVDLAEKSYMEKRLNDQGHSKDPNNWDNYWNAWKNDTKQHPALGHIYEQGGALLAYKRVNTGYHKAIAFLFAQPWRARFCAECKKRFVAAEPKNKFCSESCSHENRIRQKLESWHKNKAKWRPTKKKLRKARGKGK
jgi:hypothetical protein